MSTDVVLLRLSEFYKPSAGFGQYDFGIAILVFGGFVVSRPDTAWPSFFIHAGSADRFVSL